MDLGLATRRDPRPQTARIWGILRELDKIGLITLADKGHHGANEVITPTKARANPNRKRTPTVPTPAWVAPAMSPPDLATLDEARAIIEAGPPSR